MKNLNGFEWLAIFLVIIGGLNLGLLGLFDYNLIESIFGVMSGITRIIYTIIGLSALYLAILSPSLHKRAETAIE